MVGRISTKQLIADSIMNLMLTRSIDDISVQDIVDNCGVSRRTFYNHFSDKYMIVDWIYETQVIDFINYIGETYTWYDSVLANLNTIKMSAKFYKKIYRQEWFLNSFTDITLRAYIDVISKASPNGITKELEFMVDFFVSAYVKKVSEWILSNSREDPEKLVVSFLSCLPDGMKKYLITDKDLTKAYAYISDSYASNFKFHAG